MSGDTDRSAAVRVDSLTHVYVSDQGVAVALEGVGLTLAPGEFVSLVGPSGCGKTTLLSIIAGLIIPTEGRVSVGGTPVIGPSPKVGYMLQHDYLYPWRKIIDNCLLGLELHGPVMDAHKESARRLLADMGLAEVADRYPQELSGGMRQRVALVRTLMREPEILLLDEPFSALDYQTKLTLEGLIADTLHSRGHSALLVTHDITEAIAMSDRIVVLDRAPGRVRKIFAMPEAIRAASPMRAREQPGFHELFHEIWRELEQTEGGESP